jgi:hypothetical protein
MTANIDFGKNRALVFDGSRLDRPNKKADVVNYYDRATESTPAKSVDGVLDVVDPDRHYSIFALTDHGCPPIV